MELARGRIGGSLSRPVAGPGGRDAQRAPDVLVDPRGRTYVVFTDQRSALRISRIGPAGAIGASRALSPPGIGASSGQVAIARDGRGLAVYSLQGGARATEFRVS